MICQEVHQNVTGVMLILLEHSVNCKNRKIPQTLRNKKYNPHIVVWCQLKVESSVQNCSNFPYSIACLGKKNKWLLRAQNLNGSETLTFG